MMNIGRETVVAAVGLLTAVGSFNLNELIESGKVKPVIDRCFSLSETADAFRYFGEGQFKGKVVITVKHNNQT